MMINGNRWNFNQFKDWIEGGGEAAPHCSIPMAVSLEIFWILLNTKQALTSI